MRTPQKLGQVQLQIMQVLWERGQATARQITDALNRTQPIAHSTLQTLLRKLKPGLSQYDYVEVMACPSGCVNGGGQLPPPPGVSVQESIANVSAAYHHPQVLDFHVLLLLVRYLKKRK